MNKYKRKIARRVFSLRKGNRWTQVELAERLGITQARLSQIERGGGSFTAEQFLVILETFNVGLDDFSDRGSESHEAKLQDALARFGAVHLRESRTLVPSDHYRNINAAIKDALTLGSPRLVTALGPVLVANIDQIDLGHLNVELAGTALQRRLCWLLENVLTAIGLELDKAPPRTWAQRYRRASVLLTDFLLWADSRGRDAREAVTPPDILDRNIRSKKTLASVKAALSTVSRR